MEQLCESQFLTDSHKPVNTLVLRPIDIDLLLHMDRLRLQRNMVAIASPETIMRPDVHFIPHWIPQLRSSRRNEDAVFGLVDGVELGLIIGLFAERNPPSRSLGFLVARSAPAVTASFTRRPFSG